MGAWAAGSLCLVQHGAADEAGDLAMSALLTRVEGGGISELRGAAEVWAQQRRLLQCLWSTVSACIPPLTGASAPSIYSMCRQFAHIVGLCVSTCPAPLPLLVLIIGPTGPQFTGAGLDSTPEHSHQTSTPGICNLLPAHWLLAAVTISGLAGCSFWLLVLTKSAH